MRFQLFCLILICSTYSWAETHLVFIGGHGSSVSQMAELNLKLKSRLPDSQIKIATFPLPSKEFEKDRVLTDAKDFIEISLDSYKNLTAQDNLILVGHSSGSAVVTEIARKIKTPARVYLIILDGFYPQKVPPSIQVSCWATRDESNKHFKSPNWSGMYQCENFNTLAVKGCKTPMCLHFSVINKSAPTLNVTDKNYNTTGYSSLEPVVTWWPLKKSSDLGLDRPQLDSKKDKSNR